MKITPDLGALLNIIGVVRKMRDMGWAGITSEDRMQLDKLDARQIAAMVTVCRFTLKSRKGITLKAFAEHLGMQLSAASLLVSGMVRKRLLCRNVDSENRRYVRITLSAKGLRVLDAVMPIMESASEELFSRLTEVERAVFCEIAEKLYFSCFPNEQEMETGRG